MTGAALHSTTRPAGIADPAQNAGLAPENVVAETGGAVLRFGKPPPIMNRLDVPPEGRDAGPEQHCRRQRA
jgi:hypothetical protein